MTVYSLDAAINNIRFSLDKYRKAPESDDDDEYYDLMDKLNHLQIEYGQVLGDLKIRFPEKKDLLNDISKKSENVFFELAKATTRTKKMNVIPTALAPCAELVSIGKTLEDDKKEEKSKLADLDRRLNSLYSDFNKLQKEVDKLSRKINK